MYLWVTARARRPDTPHTVWSEASLCRRFALRICGGRRRPPESLRFSGNVGRPDGHRRLASCLGCQKRSRVLVSRPGRTTIVHVDLSSSGMLENLKPGGFSMIRGRDFFYPYRFPFSPASRFLASSTSRRQGSVPHQKAENFSWFPMHLRPDYLFNLFQF